MLRLGWPGERAAQRWSAPQSLLHTPCQQGPRHGPRLKAQQLKQIIRISGQDLNWRGFTFKSAF